MSRPALLMFVGLLLLRPSPGFAGPYIDSVAQRFLPESAFQEISEFLTGRRSDGGRLVVRSQTEDRRGYYWILLVEQAWTDLPEGSVAELRFIRPDDPEVRAVYLDIPSTVPERRQVYLGLTGEDWPFDEDAHPNAWQIRILARDGSTVLDEAASFLWRRPE